MSGTQTTHHSNVDKRVENTSLEEKILIQMQIFKAIQRRETEKKNLIIIMENKTIRCSMGRLWFNKEMKKDSVNKTVILDTHNHSPSRR